MGQPRNILTWILLVFVLSVPIVTAAASPLLAWRDPVYIAAGFAGIVAMDLLLLQPLLMGGYLPGLSPRRSRKVHQIVGSLLALAVVVHVAGLWITSPPDVIDALLFASPTNFSIWGVIAMWAVLVTAFLAALRGLWGIRSDIWRRVHTALALVIVTGSVLHAMPIQGTMGPKSKLLLCGLVVVAAVKVIADFYLTAIRKRRKR